MGPLLWGTGKRENAVTYSPLQLVIDNEIARYVRRCVRGIEVSDDTLALDLIEAIGSGGDALGAEHTVAHFRDELLLSPFFDALPWGAGNSLERDRFERLAADKARTLTAEVREPPLTPDQERAIDEVVAEAAAELGVTA